MRHGQSTGNENHDMYKYPDSAVALTTLGIKQAINAGEQLKGLMQSGYFNWRWHEVHAFSSSYTRAKQTARVVLDIMNLRHVQPIESPGINERRHGDKSGLLPENEHLVKKDAYWRPGAGGETMVECRSRFGAWYRNHAEFLLTDSDVILFMHGELMMAGQSYILGTSEDEIMKMPSRNAVPVIYERDVSTGVYTQSDYKFEQFDPTTEDRIR